MSNIDEIRSRFAGDIFATELSGITIEEAKKDYAKCAMEITPKHLNAAGGVMGGAIFTLADLAFAVAANTENNLTVTLTSQITYLSQPRGKRLYAVARALRSGKSAASYIIEITDEYDTPVASVSATGARRLGGK